MLINISQVASTTVKQAGVLNWQCLLQHAVPIPKERTQGSFILILLMQHLSILHSCAANSKTSHEIVVPAESSIAIASSLSASTIWFLKVMQESTRECIVIPDLWRAFGQRLLPPLPDTLRSKHNWCEGMQDLLHSLQQIDKYANQPGDSSRGGLVPRYFFLYCESVRHFCFYKGYWSSCVLWGSKELALLLL